MHVRCAFVVVVVAGLWRELNPHLPLLDVARLCLRLKNKEVAEEEYYFEIMTEIPPEVAKRVESGCLWNLRFRDGEMRRRGLEFMVIT